MENNKKRAVCETVGYDMNPEVAKKFFYNVYEFLLYNDTEGFLATMEYRLNLDTDMKPIEDYLVFKFMLLYLQEYYPNKIPALHPELLCIPLAEESTTAHFAVTESSSFMLSTHTYTYPGGYKASGTTGW